MARRSLSVVALLPLMIGYISCANTRALKIDNQQLYTAASDKYTEHFEEAVFTTWNSLDGPASNYFGSPSINITIEDLDAAFYGMPVVSVIAGSFYFGPDGSWEADGGFGHYLIATSPDVSVANIYFNPPIGAFTFFANSAPDMDTSITAVDKNGLVLGQDSIGYVAGRNTGRYYGFTTVYTNKIAQINLVGVSFVLDALMFSRCPLGTEQNGTFSSTGEAVCDDINECNLGVTCNSHSHCVNVPFSYKCVCDDGYAGIGSPQVCNDIDECLKGTDNCVPSATCVNTEGSFRCDCPTGFEGDGFTNGTGCVDIDECKENPCSVGRVCENTSGSYNCVCPPGTAEGPTGCTDIDECLTNPCSSLATCFNFDGSYNCTCESGYSGNGLGVDGCADVNECEDDPCANNADCSNTDGSFDCECKDGYSGNGLDSCTDIDECDTGDNDCSDKAKCTNKPGSFECACLSGYEGDGKICVDVNECDDNPCSQLAECTNTDGSFTCTCASGYDGNGIGSDGCQDINECLSNNPCDTNAFCMNNQGGFDCYCQQGFTGDGLTCLDVNECDADPCAPVAAC